MMSSWIVTCLGVLLLALLGAKGCLMTSGFLEYWLPGGSLVADAWLDVCIIACITCLMPVVVWHYAWRFVQE